VDRNFATVHFIHFIYFQLHIERGKEEDRNETQKIHMVFDHPDGHIFGAGGGVSAGCDYRAYSSSSADSRRNQSSGANGYG
jgi:hypothetical protein